MSHIGLLINIISSFLASLYTLYLFRTVYEYRFQTRRKVIFILVFSLMNGLVSSLMQSAAYKPLILIILSSVMIWYFLKTPIIQGFFAFSLYAITTALGNAALPIFFNLLIPGIDVATMQNNLLLALAANIYVNLIVFIFFVLIKPIKQYIKLIMHEKLLIVLTAATFVVICASFAMYIYSKTLNMSIYLIIALISISYCVFILLMWFNSLRKVMRDEDLKQQNFYNESLRSTLFELRRFRHDWVNNLVVIDSMIKMNKYNELKGYLSELMTHCSSHCSTQIYDIKNAGLFGILSSKISLAEEKGVAVDLQVNGEIESIPDVKISELCEVVGIFMDNAIEEAGKGENVIGVSVKNGSNFIEMSISNSCSQPPDINSIYLDGYSTKGENRGMGLTIAKKILGKYKNILHITSYENNIFTQTIEIAKRKGL